MCKICPKCGGIAEYNAYYGRTTCTRCPWESEKTKVIRYVRTGTLVRKSEKSKSTICKLRP